MKAQYSIFLLTILIISSCSTTKVAKKDGGSYLEVYQKNILTTDDMDELLSIYENYVDFKPQKNLTSSNKNEAKNSVIIAWEHTTNPTQKKTEGYKLYFGSAPGKYDGNCIDGINSPINIPRKLLTNPNTPVVKISKMKGNNICYFAITSYNEWGESLKSAPVKKEIR